MFCTLQIIIWKFLDQKKTNIKTTKPNADANQKMWIVYSNFFLNIE